MKQWLVLMLVFLALVTASCWCSTACSAGSPRPGNSVAKALDIVVPEEYARFKEVKAAGDDVQIAEAVISLVRGTQHAVMERRKDKSTQYDDLAMAQIALTNAWNEAIVGLWNKTADPVAKQMIIDEWNGSLIDSADARFQINALTAICRPSRIIRFRSYAGSDVRESQTTRFPMCDLSEPEIPTDYLTPQFISLFGQTRNRELLASFVMLFGNYGNIEQEKLLREKLTELRANPNENAQQQRILEIGIVSAIRAIQRSRLLGMPRSLSEPKIHDGLPWP